MLSCRDNCIMPFHLPRPRSVKGREYIPCSVNIHQHAHNTSDINPHIAVIYEPAASSYHVTILIYIIVQLQCKPIILIL